MAIVVRLFEAFGSHSKANLTCFFPIQAYQRYIFIHNGLQVTILKLFACRLGIPHSPTLVLATLILDQFVSFHPANNT